MGVPFVLVQWDVIQLGSYLIFVKDAQTVSIRTLSMEKKSCLVEKFSYFYTSVMGRNLEFLHMWFNFKFLHMTDVEKFKISFFVCSFYGILLHFTLFCSKKLFWRFTLFCRKIGF